MVGIRKLFMKKGQIPQRSIKIKQRKMARTGKSILGKGKNMFKDPAV